MKRGNRVSVEMWIPIVWANRLEKIADQCEISVDKLIEVLIVLYLEKNGL